MRWLSKADEDLAVADLVLNSVIAVNWAACFHAQQAAEKAIKALLVLHGVDFPLSHSLDRLAALLPTQTASLLNHATLADLTPWAVSGRYPEDIATPSNDHTRAVVDAARTAVATAKNVVSS